MAQRQFRRVMEPWHHVAITFDRDGNATGYVDGKSAGTISISAISATLSNSNSLYIGRFNSSTTEMFNGQIDDVRIFNYALTQQQINVVMNNGAVRYD